MDVMTPQETNVSTADKTSQKIEANSSREMMFSYYEERAAEYDGVYLGKGPAIAALSSEYKTDSAGISRLLSRFGRGHVIDLACGTGYWLPFYGHNCASVTLIDQSATVLARCRKRVKELDLENYTHIIQGDLFELPLDSSVYDGAIVGFLLSHFTAEEIDSFFDRLKTILKPTAELAVIDSLWSSARSPHRKKQGFEERFLNDGRSFQVYKNYFERIEFESMFEKQDFKIRSSYAGKVFIAAIADRSA
jgi:ubiquinone/menaquinone biosynthesis C-methylase UbiE